MNKAITDPKGRGAAREYYGSLSHDVTRMKK